jgi:hypothetical protein
MTRPGRLSGPVVLLAIVAAGYALGHHLVLPLLSGLGVLGTLADALITLVLILAASSVAVDQVRKHHRAIGAQGWHHGGRAVKHSILFARKGGGRLADQLAAAPGVGRWLASRAANDSPAPRGVCAACGSPGEGGERGPLVPWHDGPDAYLIDRDGPGAYLIHQSHLDAPRRVCAACGNPEHGPRGVGGDWGRLVLFRDPEGAGLRDNPYLVHQAHFEDESTGYYGQPYQEIPAGPGGVNSTNNPGGTPTMPNSRITPQHRAQRAASMSGSQVPGAWGAVVASAADLEPESDAHLIEWMNAQAAGMAAYAEGIVEAYESGTGVLGIDPKALQTLHDYADAAAQAAETMMAAKQRFIEHYELPREFAANGGLMTHDGRWVTGDGA